MHCFYAEFAGTVVIHHKEWVFAKEGVHIIGVPLCIYMTLVKIGRRQRKATTADCAFVN